MRICSFFAVDCVNCGTFIRKAKPKEVIRILKFKQIYGDNSQNQHGRDKVLH